MTDLFDFNTDDLEPLPSNDLLHDVRRSAYYQVYINGQWEADCDTYEEAETIANGKAFEGAINIERRED